MIQHDAEEAARDLETVYQEHTEHVGIVSKEHHISSASFRRHRGALGGAGAKNWSTEGANNLATRSQTSALFRDGHVLQDIASSGH